MIINSNNFAGIYFSTEGSILLGVQLFFIVLVGYVFFMVIFSYLIIHKIINYKTSPIIIKSKFARLFFEANVLEYSVAPLSVFLSTILYKFGSLAFLIISTILMLLLFLITSRA